MAAIKLPNGKVYTTQPHDSTHFGAIDKALKAGETISELRNPNINRGYGKGVIPGFVTNDGVFLDRKEAFRRAKEYGQILGMRSPRSQANLNRLRLMPKLNRIL